MQSGKSEVVVVLVVTMFVLLAVGCGGLGVWFGIEWAEYSGLLPGRDVPDTVAVARSIIYGILTVFAFAFAVGLYVLVRAINREFPQQNSSTPPEAGS